MLGAGCWVLGDKVYSSRQLRADLRRRHIRATIPVPDDQVGHRRKRGAKGGRPYAFDTEVYQGRNVVERTFSKLKDNRAFAMRTDSGVTSSLARWRSLRCASGCGTLTR